MSADFRNGISWTVASAVLWHALAGCCGHHAHEGGSLSGNADACDRHLAAGAHSAEQPCQHRDDDHAQASAALAISDGDDSHGDSCHDAPCVMANGAVRWETAKWQASFLAPQPSVDAFSCLSQGHGPRQPTLADGQPFEPPLRAHLAVHVLLI